MAFKRRDVIFIFLIGFGLGKLLGSYNDPLAALKFSSSSEELVSYQDAFDESFGFFDDITNEQWARKKAWVKGRPQSQSTRRGGRVQEYYTNNWNPDFSCPFKSIVGPVGDGHKWVCDPHRLQAVDDCLVYSIGSNGQFGFEKDLQTLAPNCEMHIFDPDDYSKSMNAQNVNGSYHAWGLTSSDEFQASLKEGTPRDAIKFKDVNEIMRLLGHEKRTIHVFKIDCEGCERGSYKDWLQVDIRQVQVETHGWNTTMPFFEDMRNAGYVMFSKEANSLTEGRCYEFSFLKLKTSFFE